MKVASNGCDPSRPSASVEHFGLQLKAERTQLLKLHQNAQRLIEPLAVMNPYADYLTFIDDRTRTRRDHENISR